MTYTVLSFHAHPDDEALLTGGTLARAAAEGHRVVLVTATAGEAGLTGPQPTGEGLAGEGLAGEGLAGEGLAGAGLAGEGLAGAGLAGEGLAGAGLAGAGLAGAGLAGRRRGELAAAAAALGCARVEVLGYPDSGPRAEEAGGFAHADVEQAARRLAALLTEEQVDVLTSYDPAGGYGHPDHVQVHRVGRRAAELAGTPVLLEATVDRRLLQRGARLARLLPGVPADFAPQRFARSYSDAEVITHQVDVRGFAAAKRAAMAAHASQRAGGGGLRTLEVFLRLPMPVFRLAFGREWFVEPGRPPGRLDDIFATLRPAPARRAR